jgi:hypothetical protein
MVLDFKILIIFTSMLYFEFQMFYYNPTPHKGFEKNK